MSESELVISWSGVHSVSWFLAVMFSLSRNKALNLVSNCNAINFYSKNDQELRGIDGIVLYQIFIVAKKQQAESI